MHRSKRDAQEHMDKERDRSGYKIELRTTMHAKDSVLDDDRECEIIKHVGKVGPYARRTVLAYAFGVESVRLWNDAMN